MLRQQIFDCGTYYNSEKVLQQSQIFRLTLANKDMENQFQDDWRIVL